MDYTIYGLFIVAMLTLSIALYKKFYPGQYKDDNKVELFVENVIDSTTGIKVDLTPGSVPPEANNATPPIVTTETK